jgi:formate dehydrogenase maturation protein FdhE
VCSATILSALNYQPLTVPSQLHNQPPTRAFDRSLKKSLFNNTSSRRAGIARFYPAADMLAFAGLIGRPDQWVLVANVRINNRSRNRLHREWAR